MDIGYNQEHHNPSGKRHKALTYPPCIQFHSISCLQKYTWQTADSGSYQKQADHGQDRTKSLTNEEPAQILVKYMQTKQQDQSK